MYDVMVIGGGPAALSAAFYTMGKAVNWLLLCEDLGGKVGWLESLAGPDRQHYLPGNELVHLLTRRLMAQPERMIYDRALSVTRRAMTFAVETREHGVQDAATLIVATGARPIMLDVPGAQRLVERGLGYSITTYAHLAAGKHVAVIGTTPRALSGAAELARSVARLSLIAPHASGLATPLGSALRQQPHVEVFENYEVLEVIGQTMVEALRIARDGQTRQLEVDRAFVDLGLVPNSELVQGIATTDADGFIVVNAGQETTLPGLFAAGDVTTAFGEQVLAAIGDGARAAMSTYDYLLARWLTGGTITSG